MGNWIKLVLVASALGVAAGITGCSGAQSASGDGTAATTTAPAQPAAPAAETVKPVIDKPAEPVAPKVSFSGTTVRLDPPKNDKVPGEWRIQTRIRNDDTVAMDGLEIVLDLHREGQEHAERVHGTQVRFSPALAPGKSWPLTVVLPEPDRKVDAAGVTASPRAIRALKPLTGPAWRPLDLARATPKSVSAKSNPVKISQEKP